MSTPVSDKIREYAHRLRDLVAEAYREGIVLTVHDPGERPEVLSPAEGFEKTQGTAYLPYDGHVHFNMARPMYVRAAAIVKKDANGKSIEMVGSVVVPPP